MCKFVVDASAISAFQKERISGESAMATTAMGLISKKTPIVLDAEGHCLQEWMDCAAGTHPFALSAWVADQFTAGTIEYGSFCPDTLHKTLNGHGLEKKDHKWVRLCAGATAPYLITNDIDFFDPTKKKGDTKTRIKIMSDRTGPCAKFLRKKLGIEVMTFDHVGGFVCVVDND